MNTKRTCRHCRKKSERTSMLITPLAAFCNSEHAYAHTTALRQRKAADEAKSFRRETTRMKVAAKPKSGWAKDAQTAVNRYVRLRDRNEGCISCDKPANWSGQWHASHFYSRGHSSALRFNLWNNHKSCSVCNNHLSGNIGEYRPRIIEKIGQARYDWLLEHKSDLAEHSVDYLKRVKAIFTKRCRILEKRMA